MALFLFIVLLVYNGFTCLLGSINNGVENELKISPSRMTAGRYIGLYEVQDTLNLTCSYGDPFNLSNVFLQWIVPNKSLSRLKPGPNALNLVIYNLTERDSGEYVCTAKNENMEKFKQSISINVQNKKGECPETMFRCSLGKCILKRYTCDGFSDCAHGEDESYKQCGTGDPCENKLRCPDHRCIPYAWCCDHDKDRNCTSKAKHSCCIHMEKLTHDIDIDLRFEYEQKKLNHMSFFKTTVYTVTGCALVFMFIGTIIVLVDCRLHMRRSLLSRCQPGSNRTVRASNLQSTHLNRLPFCDFSNVYFNRSDYTNDLMAVNPLLVSYNMNNGVQFVGRPIDPPPYCEILHTPLRKGPPPPYTSRENLTSLNSNKQEERKDSTSDAVSGDRISFISSNAIDEVVDSTEQPPQFYQIVEENRTGNGSAKSDENLITKDLSGNCESGQCANCATSQNNNVVVPENSESCLNQSSSSCSISTIRKIDNEMM